MMFTSPMTHVQRLLAALPAPKLIASCSSTKCCVACCVCSQRCRLEAEVLLRKFGVQYERYAKSTKLFLPFVV